MGARRGGGFCKISVQVNGSPWDEAPNHYEGNST